MEEPTPIANEFAATSPAATDWATTESVATGSVATGSVATGIAPDDAYAYRPDEAKAYVPPTNGPGYGGYSYPGDFSKLNTYSVLSLIFAFIFAPVGIVFGALALGLSKIPGTPRWMKTMGTVGFWLSIANVVLPLLILIPLLFFGLLASRASISPSFGGPMVCTTNPAGETVCTSSGGITTVRPLPGRVS